MVKIFCLGRLLFSFLPQQATHGMRAKPVVVVVGVVVLVAAVAAVVEIVAAVVIVAVEVVVAAPLLAVFLVSVVLVAFRQQ